MSTITILHIYDIEMIYIASGINEMEYSKAHMHSRTMETHNFTIVLKQIQNKGIVYVNYQCYVINCQFLMELYIRLLKMKVMSIPTKIIQIKI